MATKITMMKDAHLKHTSLFFKNARTQNARNLQKIFSN